MPPMKNSVKYGSDCLAARRVHESVTCASTIATTARPRSQSRYSSRCGGSAGGQGSTSSTSGTRCRCAASATPNSIFARQRDRALDGRRGDMRRERETQRDTQHTPGRIGRSLGDQVGSQGLQRWRPLTRMSTTSAAMQPARLNASASTGDGPAALSPSSVTLPPPVVATKRRSPCHASDVATVGLDMVKGTAEGLSVLSCQSIAKQDPSCYFLSISEREYGTQP